MLVSLDSSKFIPNRQIGSRTCIGKNISLLEMTKLIPELLRRFDFELGEDLKGNVEWRWISYWLARPASLPVTVSLRQRE